MDNIQLKDSEIRKIRATMEALEAVCERIQANLSLGLDGDQMVS